ncbi:hypothetical protein [Streptomyces phytophilus]|uniref:hypothetical protein n=1 Tax=Streptomyces phytophilus TaxID=722715 RepID=UPI0015F0E53B|nr:hypothetical protein [Streptomyces phytophilus]
MTDHEPPLAPDWWDRLYADDPDAGPVKRPAPHPDPDPPPDTEARPWWAVLHPARKHPAPEPAPRDDPGVHITINQPPTPYDDPTAPRRRASARWFLYHGAAAAVGWAFGAADAVGELLAAAGPRAPAVGIGLCLIACMPAAWLPGLPFIPPPLRPATVWLARIPLATAALALALHAPGTVI